MAVTLAATLFLSACGEDEICEDLRSEQRISEASGQGWEQYEPLLAGYDCRTDH